MLIECFFGTGLCSDLFWGGVTTDFDDRTVFSLSYTFLHLFAVCLKIFDVNR